LRFVTVLWVETLKETLSVWRAFTRWKAFYLLGHWPGLEIVNKDVFLKFNRDIFQKYTVQSGKLNLCIFNIDLRDKGYLMVGLLVLWMDSNRGFNWYR